MSGFRDDVIAILRDNVLLHSEAMGLVMEAYSWPQTRELLKDLEDRKMPVTDRADKHVFLFDFVVIPQEWLYVHTLLRAFTLVGNLGIIIIEVTGKADLFKKELVSQFGNFTVTKLTYGDRAYLVVHQGADYGN